MFGFNRKKKDEEPIDPEARSPQLGIKNKDVLLLGQLMQQGANLSLPRHALYYLYFPSRSAAESGAEEGRTAGYTCEVRDPLPQYPDQWSLVCERPDAVLDRTASMPPTTCSRASPIGSAANSTAGRQPRVPDQHRRAR